MVFFGLRTSSDQEIRRMEEEIVKLAQLREIKRQNRLSLLQRELDFSILAARVGNTVAQSIISSQYVMGCIAVYFKREWIDYYLNTFSPIVELYHQLPDAATQAKFTLAQRYSFAQRLTAVTLATTIVCARSASPSVSGAMMAAGKVLGSFGALSFLTLPQLGQSVAHAFDSFVY